MGIAPLEALTGFVLLTTALAWFAQIYPPLSRRRALALQLHSWRMRATVADVDAVTLPRVLGLRQQFLRSGTSAAEVFSAYAADHGHELRE